MVEFKIKVHPKQHTAYIPKELLNALGFRWGASHHGSVMCAYPLGTSDEAIIESLEMLLAHYRIKKGE